MNIVLDKLNIFVKKLVTVHQFSNGLACARVSSKSSIMGLFYMETVGTTSRTATPNFSTVSFPILDTLLSKSLNPASFAISSC